MKSKALKKSPAPEAPPSALIAFMKQHWAPAPALRPEPLAGAKTFSARRAALAARFPKETLVIPTGHETVRANDTHYRFRPGSDFVWLTGYFEPDAVLVLTSARGGRSEAHLFVEPNPGKTSERFFTDRKRGALWVGPRFGVPEARTLTGVEVTHALDELPAFLRTHRRARVLRGHSASTDALVAPRSDGEADRALAAVLAELRLFKDELEIRAIEQAIAMTKRGYEDVIRGLPMARTERAVECLFSARARLEGNDVGFETIAASGANACTLHYQRNDAPLKRRDLLLLDAGVEGPGLYTADITRTLPISGRFSPAQRTVYELVHRARAAALAHVKPGNDFLEPNRQAMRVFAEGLESLGILPTSAEEALKEEHQFYRRYTLHNISHMLGLDVHDCASAKPELVKQGTLKPGMVLTIEPGLYFQPDDLTVPKRFRGIGVRVEDDVLVTEKGCRVLSSAIPTAPDDVEQWMASVQSRS